MTTIATKNAPAAIGPYSQGQIVGNLVITSGQIGIDPATGELPATVVEQAHQSFKNVAAVLKAAGSDISKTVKTTVFIQNMSDFAAINEVYAQYFSEPYPARSCVEVAKLPKGALVETEAIAEL